MSGASRCKVFKEGSGGSGWCKVQGRFWSFVVVLPARCQAKCKVQDVRVPTFGGLARPGVASRSGSG